jgi:hypothetical protein
MDETSAGTEHNFSVLATMYSHKSSLGVYIVLTMCLLST